MNNLGDYLDKKAQKLDLGRGDELAEIQKLLDGWYPSRCRAYKLNNGKLTIKTKSSSVANELRFKTAVIIDRYPEIVKVIISS